MFVVGSPSTSTRSASSAHRDAAAVAAGARISGAVAGCDLQHLRRGQPGTHVELEFAVQREAGEPVGAGHDGNAGAVQAADEVDQLGV